RLVALPVDVHFDERLQDQPVGQQQLVLRLEAEMRAARLAQVRGGLHLEPVRCQSLDADGGPGAPRPGTELLANTADDVPPTADGPPVEHLRFRVLDAAALFAGALRPEPQAVEVAADPPR